MLIRQQSQAAAILVVSLLAAGRTCATGAAPWAKIVVGTQSESERLATVDLQRCLGQVTGEVPVAVPAATWRLRPIPAVVLGSPATNPVLASIGAIPRNLGLEGYYLANATVNNVPVVIAAGRSKAGCVNAVYGMLRELGYGFFLGSEAVPDVLPAALPSQSPLVRRPVFGIRGVLPWYNFFDSPTTWDPVDHRAFVDQLVRSGANFVGFHTYDSEPFAAYEEGGQMKAGARLLNTNSPTWGTHPLPCNGFAYGTERLFAGEAFGAATTQRGDDAIAAIRQEQDVMRDAQDLCPASWAAHLHRL